PAVATMIVLIFAVREPSDRKESTRPEETDIARPALPRPLLAYFAVLAVFTLGNSSDAFLLLRASQSGVPEAQLPLLWAFIHVVKATLSTPLGSLSDRLGRKPTILAGWVVYAACYLGFALAHQAWQVWALFAVYGAFFAATEGTEKALVADLSPPDARGRAF